MQRNPEIKKKSLVLKLEMRNQFQTTCEVTLARFEEGLYRTVIFEHYPIGIASPSS